MDWDYQATTSVLQSRFIDLDQREDRRKVCQYVILEVIIAWKTTQNFERSEEVDHQMMDNAKLTRTKEYFNEQVDLTLVWEMMPMSCLNRLISELSGYKSTRSNTKNALVTNSFKGARAWLNLNIGSHLVTVK